jgi:hypothetical protein
VAGYGILGIILVFIFLQSLAYKILIVAKRCRSLQDLIDEFSFDFSYHNLTNLAPNLANFGDYFRLTVRADRELLMPSRYSMYIY